MNVNTNNLNYAYLSGDYKSFLINQAFEVENLLKKYVNLHDKRLKTAGTFRSLFRKVNFEEIYKEIDELYQDFEEKRVEIMAMEGDYTEYTKTQQDFHDILVSYYSALFEAVELLYLLSNKQNELSKGLGKDKLTLSEDLNLEKKYKGKIKEYMNLGGKLNESFQKLKDEVTSN